MKLLLDENLPKRLKQDLFPHEAFTVRDKGWNGKGNGELLALMKQEGFDVLLTFDKNVEFQQNFKKYDLPVIVLDAEDNTYPSLSPLTRQVLAALEGELQPGVRIVC